MLAGLGCATAVVFVVRGQGATPVVMVSLLMASAVLVGLAALRMLRPLVAADEDRTPMVGQRTRVALEREKMLALRSIKELEFDRAMGKLSEADWREMSGRLRARAARLMRQLDAGAGYREQIERDLEKRLGSDPARLKGSRDTDNDQTSPATASAERTCAACSTVNDADARFCKTCGTRLLAMLVLCVLAVLGFSGVASAQFAMPDMKQMSGIPRPVSDLPDHAISVRLIRGDLSNNITNFPVELRIGSKVQTVKTDETGRAQFNDVPPGTTVKAVAVVDGERLESQEFPAPERGGVRLMLVATDKAKKAEPVPTTPVPGQVDIGAQSRIIIEPGDEAVQVFYLLNIQNKARAPVNPTVPFTFDMPTGAVGTSVLEGSSPQASVNGTRVRVQGPFAPGQTFVQVACEIPVLTGSLGITQRFPAAVEQLAVVVKKVGATKLTSPQIANQQEMTAQGEAFIAASGGAVPAGQPIVLSLEDVPHHSAVPRWIALGLVMAILAAGAWAATRPEDRAVQIAERKRLLARRDKLLAELVRLETDRRNGRVDGGRYAARREDLVAALEHIYGALDSDDTSPGTDRAGLAA